MTWGPIILVAFFVLVIVFQVNQPSWFVFQVNQASHRLQVNQPSWLDVHFSVDGTCSGYHDFLRAYNNSKWLKRLVSHRELFEQKNLRRASYAQSIVHATPLCADFPDELEGPVNASLAAVPWSDMEAGLTAVEDGGAWQPKDCRPRHRIAVIIPYRDRDVYLRVLLNHLHPFLQKQKLEYRIFVAEQDFQSELNRGMIRNIGALYALQAQDFDCLYFHDVDLLPINDHNLYYCRDTPRHLSTAIKEGNYERPFPNKYHFGGVATIMKEQFLAVNGYSNVYFQWGSEDDDLSKRVRYMEFGLEQNLPALGRYTMIPHRKDKPNQKRWNLFKFSHCRTQFDGLNNLHYKLLSLENRPLYTHILVSINETEVMENTPVLHPPPARRKAPEEIRT